MVAASLTYCVKRQWNAAGKPGRIVVPRHKTLSSGVARVIAKQAGWM
jgi:hypothetical protein